MNKGWFTDLFDPAIPVTYIEVPESLCQKNLEKYDNGNLYVLTRKGFNIARWLKKQERSFSEGGRDQT